MKGVSFFVIYIQIQLVTSNLTWNETDGIIRITYLDGVVVTLTDGKDTLELEAYVKYPNVTSILEEYQDINISQTKEGLNFRRNIQEVFKSARNTQDYAMTHICLLMSFAVVSISGVLFALRAFQPPENLRHHEARLKIVDDEVFLVCLEVALFASILYTAAIYFLYLTNDTFEETNIKLDTAIDELVKKIGK